MFSFILEGWNINLCDSFLLPSKMKLVILSMSKHALHINFIMFRTRTVRALIMLVTIPLRLLRFRCRLRYGYLLLGLLVGLPESVCHVQLQWPYLVLTEGHFGSFLRLQSQLITRYFHLTILTISYHTNTTPKLNFWIIWLCTTLRMSEDNYIWLGQILRRLYLRRLLPAVFLYNMKQLKQLNLEYLALYRCFHWLPVQPVRRPLIGRTI